MRKRFLAVLMALSLASTSALGNTGSITVHAEEEVTEPAAEDVVIEEVPDEIPSEEQAASGSEEGTSEQAQENEESSSGASSSAASTASSEDSPEEEKPSEEVKEENSDESGNGDSMPEETVTEEQTEAPSENQVENPSEEGQNTDDLFNFDDAFADEGEDEEPSVEDMIRESKRRGWGTYEPPEVIEEGDTDGMHYVLYKDGKLELSGTNIRRPPLSSENVAKVKTADVSGVFAEKCNLFSTFDGPSSSYSFSNLEKVKFHDIDTSNVKSMNSMFRGCSTLKSLDLAGFDTKNVTDMGSMFASCWGLTSIDLTSFDTSNVVNMNAMFTACSSLASLDIENFVTSKVTNMEVMFSGCSSLKTLDLRKFDARNVETMSSMLTECTTLEELRSPMNIPHQIDLPGEFFIDDNYDDKSDDGTTVRAIKGATITDTSFSGSHYQIYNKRVTWTEAKEHCEKQGGHLATITSKEEQAFIEKLNSNNARLWIGGHRDSSNTWYWVTGEAWDYTNWDDGEPNNSSNVVANENSVAVWPKKWNDLNEKNTSEQSGFICEWEDTDNSGKSHHYLKKGCKSTMKPDSPEEVEISEYTSCDADYFHYRNGKDPAEKWAEKGGLGTVHLDLHRNWFLSKGSTDYNHDIATYAIGLATMAYTEYNIEASDENVDCSMVPCFKELGYVVNGELKRNRAADAAADNAEINGINGEKDLVHYMDEGGDLIYVRDDDSAGRWSTFWIGYTPLDNDSVLVTVNIRGTDRNEWIDDFKPETELIHKGFDNGAKSVLFELKEYLESHDFNGEKVKMLVTGHSRGAAVANLVGYYIDNALAEYSLESMEDLFVYSFACPNSSRESVDERKASKYDNLYSIINPEDFVTKVMLSEWGYGRYGKSLVLPSGTISKPDVYAAFLGKLKQHWSDYYCAGYSGMYAPYINGMKAVTIYVTRVKRNVDDVVQYYDKRIKLISLSKVTLYNLYIDTLATYMAAGDNIILKGIAINSIKDALKGAYGLVGEFTVEYFGLHQPTNKDFEHAHQPETYRAAMLAVGELNDDLFELKRNKEQILGIVNCPVDIKITDDNGTLVGEIANDEIILEEGAVALDVDGDSKSFFLPSIGNYHVSLIGNDEGTMDYALNSYDCDTLSGPRIYYNDLPLVNGKTYEMDIVGGEIINSYELKDENGSVIPKVEIPEDQINSLAVEVSVIGNGAADSVYNLTPGDYVSLVAVAAENNKFVGWYDESDTLLSTESEYGFSIAKNEKITAKFAGITGADSQGSESQGGNNGNSENGNAESAHPGNNQNNAGANNQNPTVNTAGTEKTVLPVGTEFTSAGKVYRVTGDDTLAVIKLENKKAKTCSIPSSVVHEGKAYSVTEVSSKAFKGMKKLKSATIPSTVTKIGSKAFYNCSNLKKVTVKANSDLSVGKSAFKKVSKDCTIKVKGLKKKAKKSMVDKIKKQTNGTVK